MRGTIPPLIHTTLLRGDYLDKAYIVMGWDLVKLRENFTFLPYIYGVESLRHDLHTKFHENLSAGSRVVSGRQKQGHNYNVIIYLFIKYI